MLCSAVPQHGAHAPPAPHWNGQPKEDPPPPSPWTLVIRAPHRRGEGGLGEGLS